MSSPYTFPVSKMRDYWSSSSHELRHIIVTDNNYPQGNSTRRVEAYTVTIYDVSGHLHNYNHPKIIDHRV